MEMQLRTGGCNTGFVTLPNLQLDALHGSARFQPLTHASPQSRVNLLLQVLQVHLVQVVQLLLHVLELRLQRVEEARGRMPGLDIVQRGQMLLGVLAAPCGRPRAIQIPGLELKLQLINLSKAWKASTGFSTRGPRCKGTRPAS